jgi:membrane protein DedA with SNARE-associated domain
MLDLQDLIVQYGYWALFIGTFLEGETILIIAGFLAYGGYLALPWVILSAFLGTFAGDQTFFFLGRSKGIQFLENRPRLKRKSERAFNLLHRHQILVILGFRFLYGIRNVTPFVIGASNLNPLRFFLLNFLGALTWAVSFGYLGYHLGTLAETALHDIHRYEKVILIVLLAGATLAFLISNLRKK